MTKGRIISYLFLLALGFFAGYFLKSTITTKPSAISPTVKVVEETKIPIPTSTIQVKEDCEKNNGRWTKGPFGEGPFCNMQYTDGGKTCNDSKDCLSQQCILYSGNKTGECAYESTNYGCYRLLEKGILTKFACRD